MKRDREHLLLRIVKNKWCYLFLVGAILFSSKYCIAGHKIYNAPARLQARYEKSRVQSDTFIMYNRSCGECLRGTPYLSYFVYKKRGKITLEVYAWNVPFKGPKAKRIIKRNQKEGDLVTLLNFITDHYAALEKESANETPFRQVPKHVADGKEEYIIYPDRNIDLHGPIMEYEIAINGSSLKGRVLGGYDIKGISAKLPVTANLMQYFHNIYSRYSVETIVDTKQYSE